MIPVSHALKRVFYETRQVIGSGRTEEIPIEDGLGRVCAQDAIRVPSPGYPTYRASIMDGYALCHKQNDDPIVKKQIVGNIHAGDNDTTLTTVMFEERSAVYITTGAIVPEPFNVVVPIESVTVNEEENCIIWDSSTKKLPAHNWIRPVGCDLPEETIIVKKGDVLTHVHLALLTQISIQTILVTCPIKVGLISTGTEVWNQQIPDANKILLKRFFQSMYSPSIQIIDYGIFPDFEETKLSNLLLSNPDSCQIMISTGGISKGDADILQNVITQHRSTFMKRHFHQLFMKPGKPTTFVTINDKLLLFGLPGNPVSAMVCTHLLVQPCLEYYLTNGTVPTVQPEYYHATFGSTILKLDPQRPEYHRVTFSSDMQAMTSTGKQISSRLQSVCQANGLAMLPQGSTENQNQTKQNKPYPVILMNEPFITGRRIPFVQSHHYTNATLTYTLLTITSTTSNTTNTTKIVTSHENTHCVKHDHLQLCSDTDQWKEALQSKLMTYTENDYFISDLLWIQVHDDVNFVQGLELSDFIKIQKSNLTMAHSIRSMQQSALFSPIVGFIKPNMMMVAISSTLKHMTSIPPHTMIPLFRHAIRQTNAPLFS